ncbi:MAG: hypothetical protein ACFE0P_03840 [Oceanicaulis sp.]
MSALATSNLRAGLSLALAVLALAAAPGRAEACPGYDLVPVLTEGRIYDPADPAASFVSFDLRAADPDLPNGCRNKPVTIEIVGGTAQNPELRSGAAVLQADWENDPLVRRNGPRFRLTNQARRALGRGETIRFRLYRLPAAQFVDAGAYEQLLRFSAGNTETVFPLEIAVSPALRFEGDSAAGVQTLDLGEISRGGRASSDFFFRTNAPVSVTLVSDNRGRLVHERGEDFGAIAYQASLSGAPVDLTGPGGAVVRGRFTAGGVQAGRLAVETGPARAAYAGRYRDVITLTFIPY